MATFVLIQNGRVTIDTINHGCHPLVKKAVDYLTVKDKRFLTLKMKKKIKIKLVDYQPTIINVCQSCYELEIGE